jgi:hypothetical protein
MELLDILEARLPLYLQMVDPSSAGPADQEALKVFMALNKLNVITVRPLMIAISESDDPQEGLDFILRLVVRRMIVGNLGTGNIERRFSDAARKVHETGRWSTIIRDLADLNPTEEEFVEQLKRRSFNKGTLSFIRNSIVSRSIAPDTYYTLHFVLPRTIADWPGFDEDERAYWATTIGNTFLSASDRRPDGTANWQGFIENMLPIAAPGEMVDAFRQIDHWDANAVRNLGARLAEVAGRIWYER